MPWWWCNLIFFFILIYRYAFGSNAFSICPWTTLILTLRQTDFFVQKINFTAINGLTDLKWSSGSLISSDDDLILKMISRPLIGHLNRFFGQNMNFWYSVILFTFGYCSFAVLSSVLIWQEAVSKAISLQPKDPFQLELSCHPTWREL